MKKCIINFMGRAIFSMALTFLTGFNLSGTTLNPGDIVYADSGNPTEGGFIVKVDPQTGIQSVVSSGGNLVAPFGVAITDDGQIIVSDSGRLIQIEPETGRQKVVATKSAAPLGFPYGIDVEPSGEIVTANAIGILRIDTTSGEVDVLASGQHLSGPIGVTVVARNELFVADTASARVVHVRGSDGLQKVVSEGGYLKRPQSIAVKGSDIYLTDVATADGNFGIGRVIRVNARTGRQDVVAEGGYLVGPVGLAVDANGNLIVGDPYTINPQSRDLYDGAIIRIDLASGRQTLIARGSGSCVNPRGVAIVGSFQKIGRKSLSPKTRTR
jgi:sugar lactone lactonase YvrE